MYQHTAWKYLKYLYQILYFNTKICVVIYRLGSKWFTIYKVAPYDNEIRQLKDRKTKKEGWHVEKTYSLQKFNKWNTIEQRSFRNSSPCIQLSYVYIFNYIVMPLSRQSVISSLNQASPVLWSGTLNQILWVCGARTIVLNAARVFTTTGK